MLEETDLLNNYNLSKQSYKVAEKELLKEVDNPHLPTIKKKQD